MPVRSLNSSICRWPDAATVIAAARHWAENLTAHEPGVLAVGYFGSYARGQAGVGSDLDLVVIIRDGSRGADPRDQAWAVEMLPVPAERLVYSVSQWNDLRAGGGRFYRTLACEARWLVGGPPPAPQGGTGTL